MIKAIRILWKAVSALLFIASLGVSFAPPTASETAVLGEHPARFDLVQKRLAYAMMTLAPDFFAARYAQAVGVDPDLMRAHLLAAANGTAAPQAPIAAPPIDTAATAPPSRRTVAGGALFVRPD